MQFKAVIFVDEQSHNKSKRPVVLQDLCGKSIIHHTLLNISRSGIDHIDIVLNTNEEQSTSIKKEIDAIQSKENIQQVHTFQDINEVSFAEEHVLSMNAFTPLISSETIKQLIHRHTENGAKATVLSSYAEVPFGYDRIIRDGHDNVVNIISEQHLSQEDAHIDEVFGNIFIVNGTLLNDTDIGLEPKKFKSVFELNNIEKIGVHLHPDFEELLLVNDLIYLSNAESILRERINIKHMQNGVRIIDPLTTYIDDTVEIGADTIIYPNTVIKGYAKIGEDVYISANCEIVDAIIGNNATIKHSVITEAVVGERTSVGPYAQLRPKAQLGADVKIGNFVEVKKSELRDEVKVSHLSYIGDAIIDERTNVGCGTITVNYDGKNKYLTEIGKDAFIGCNSNLVAPVKVGDRTFIAAGSTITDEVPDDSLAIARNRQTTKEGYYKKD